MSSCPDSVRPRPILPVFAALIAGAALVLACAPEFPVSVLDEEQSGLLFAPRGNFALEIRRAFPVSSASSARPAPPAGRNEGGPFDSFSRSAEIDVRQLEEALLAAGVDAPTRDRALAEYRDARLILANARRAIQVARERGEANAPLPVVMPDLPECVPAEFRLHLRGLVALARGKPDDAVAAWKELLALPEPQRQLRTVWASYMIGRTLVDERPGQAAEWLQRVRKLADDGFSDPLGLRRESLGWEALAAHRLGHDDEAIRLYLAQHQAGDETAMQSLRLIAHRVLGRADAGQLARLAGEDSTRRVMTAFVLEQYSIARYWTNLDTPPSLDPWLDALEALPRRSLADADRIAWLLYQQGRFASAARWIRLADARSPLTAWIDAKLLLRDGRIEDGTARLADAVRGFSRLERWEDIEGGPWPWAGLKPRDRAAAELAALRLSRGNFDEALRLLLIGDYWLDAAYIAERIMTVDELRRFVDSRARRDPWDVLLNPQPETEQRLRQLLARRLIRSERFDDARSYLDPEEHDALMDLADGLAVGRDESRSLAQRAEGYVRAARALRHHGLELVGYELDPDWAMYAGNFEDDPVGNGRAPVDHLAGATTLELRRREENAPRGTQRWHYRYIAADLMWEACYLLPNDSDQTAELLREGGMWLAARDPKAADRFYKALVRRCGNTALGRQANRLRWFPPVAKDRP